MLQIQAFLRNMPYTPTHNKESHVGGDRADDSLIVGSAEAVPLGITWLELYALYRMAGWPEPLATHTLQAATRPTLRQQLHAFRQATRLLVHSTMPTTSQTYFKGSSQMGGKRLASLGINTLLAVMPWQPCLTMQAKDRVAKEVLRSQYRLSHAEATQAIAEHTRLPLRQVQLKGRTNWSKTIHHYKPPLYTTPTQSPDHTHTHRTQATASTSGAPTSTSPGDFHQSHPSQQQPPLEPSHPKLTHHMQPTNTTDDQDKPQ